MDHLTFQWGGDFALAGIILTRPFISFKVASYWESNSSETGLANEARIVPGPWLARLLRETRNRNGPYI